MCARCVSPRESWGRRKESEKEKAEKAFVRLCLMDALCGFCQRADGIPVAEKSEYMYHLWAWDLRVTCRVLGLEADYDCLLCDDRSTGMFL